MNPFDTFTKFTKSKDIGVLREDGHSTWFSHLASGSDRLMEIVNKENGKTVFEEYVQDCHPFVFAPDLDASGSWNTAWSEDEEAKLDLPYPIMSIELSKGSITVPHPSDPIKVSIKMILVKEVAPKEYTFFHISEIDGEINATLVYKTEGKEWAAFNGLLKIYLKRLSKEKLGVETRGNKVKVGSGKKKFFWRPNAITHVSGAKYQNHVRPTVPSATINWTHRWEVRGHWRTIQGIGKDRAGDYKVSGYTWVSNHVKGPENSPIIRKTYMVSE